MPEIFMFWQFPKSPRRHCKHVPSCPPCQPTPTLCPFCQPVTPSPNSSMTPATSCPGMRGYWMPGHKPSFVSTSLWHTPHAWTLISTCPAPALGISRSTISNSPPAFEICATFIGANPTFVVAITASYLFSAFSNFRPLEIHPFLLHAPKPPQPTRSCARPPSIATHPLCRLPS